MILSRSAIEAMGFTSIPIHDPIEAESHRLNIFEARGIQLSEGVVVSTQGLVDGVQFGIAGGHSVNEVCRALWDEGYPEDEASWRKEHNCSPPYLVVRFGPTAPYKATTGHEKASGETILTYDSFSSAREEIAQVEARALPAIELALARAFADGRHPVRFIPIDRITYGLTSDGKTLHDVRITGHAHGDVSAPMDESELMNRPAFVSKSSGELSPRVARFFQLGSHDEDDLKQFLYYFLAIEIEVHRVFKSVPRVDHLANGADLNPRVAMSLRKVLEDRDENWANLAERFVWCVASVWDHLGDDDVTEFRRMKKTRDRIAHGDIASPDRADVVAAERLLMRMVLPGGIDVR